MGALDKYKIINDSHVEVARILFQEGSSRYSEILISMISMLRSLQVSRV